MTPTTTNEEEHLPRETGEVGIAWTGIRKTVKHKIHEIMVNTCV